MCQNFSSLTKHKFKFQTFTLGQNYRELKQTNKKEIDKTKLQLCSQKKVKLFHMD